MKEQKTDGGKLLASAHTLLVKYADEPEPQPPQPPVPQQQDASQPPQQTVSPPQQQPVLQQQPQTGLTTPPKINASAPATPRAIDHIVCRAVRRTRDKARPPTARAAHGKPAPAPRPCETGPARSAAYRRTAPTPAPAPPAAAPCPRQHRLCPRQSRPLRLCLLQRRTGARTLDSSVVPAAKPVARLLPTPAPVHALRRHRSPAAKPPPRLRSLRHRAAADGGRRATSSGTHAYAGAAGAEAGPQDARYSAVTLAASPLRSSR